MVKRKETQLQSRHQPWGKLFEEWSKLIAQVNAYISNVSLLHTTESYVQYGLGLHDALRALFIMIEIYLKKSEADKIVKELAECHNVLLRGRDVMITQGKFVDKTARIPPSVYNVVTERLVNVYRTLWRKMQEIDLALPTWSEEDRVWKEEILDF